MATDRPPPGFLIAAQIRLAAQEGVPMVVRNRGDETHGTIILKINLLNRTARVLTQARYGDDAAWNPISRTDPMPESDAERYLDQQLNIDPDIWIVEIEDREGRIWFPGKVIKL